MKTSNAAYDFPLIAIGTAAAGYMLYKAFAPASAAAQTTQTSSGNTQATGGDSTSSPPAGTAPVTGTTPQDVWYQNTLNRLKTKLDQLHATAADDQYWRAIFWLNGQHVPGFRVPNNFPDNQMDRYAALRYVSDIVFAQPNPAGEPTVSEGTQQTIQVLAMASAGISAYHGYRRNNSIGWALVWGFFGGIAPIVTPAIAFAQGFGEPARRNPVIYKKGKRGMVPSHYMLPKALR